MRVLFTSSHFAAHFQPLVPLGWALRAAGHEVAVTAGPGIAAAVTGAGLTAVPLAEDVDMITLGRFKLYRDALRRAGRGPLAGLPVMHPLEDRVLASLDEFDPGAFMREYGPGLAKLVDARIDATVRFARRWRPDLVVTELMCFDGVLAGAVLGVPVVRHLWGPLGTAEPDPDVADIVGDDMTGAAARYGLEPVEDGAGWVLDVCPPSVRPPVREERIPMRYVPYGGPASHPLDPADGTGRPRLCVTWSRSAPRLFGPRSLLVNEILQAAAGMDVDVRVAVGDEQRSAIRIPEGRRARVTVGRVPLEHVLPSADAVVHAGGAGVTMTALRHGVPQLGLPLSNEFAVNVERVAAAGAAVLLPPADAGVPQIRRCLRELLEDPAWRESAGRLRRESLELPAPAAVVPVLEEIAASPR
ncbi:nucleotide disphospho-sugar-binding domain-containing protein [Actinomadura formosensis]|uniref:nucleotide disphospho-sugar-binding domain-containing protein n=1 Tax=Actinomadura formosensis TaxID=60706 RepID=UPI003D8A69DA